MFKSGDIVIWSGDSKFWVIIAEDLPSQCSSNSSVFRMRRKNEKNRLPDLMLASSEQVELVYRPYFVKNQKLVFRRYIVSVIEDAGERVHCKIVGMSDCRPYAYPKFDLALPQRLQILRSALVESNMAILMSS